MFIFSVVVVVLYKIWGYIVVVDGSVVNKWVVGNVVVNGFIVFCICYFCGMKLFGF